MRTTRRGALLATGGAAVVFNAGLLVCLLWWWWSRDPAAALIGAAAGFFAFWVNLDLLVGQLVPGGPVLVFRPDGVLLPALGRSIPYVGIGLVLTWTAHDSTSDIGPVRYLAIVPHDAVAAVHAAPRPRIPYLGGPFRASGAPAELDRFTIRERAGMNLDSEAIIAELRRRGARPRVEHLGRIPRDL